MKVHQQNSYILHCTPYSESSLIVHAFTKDHGRFTLLAKGGRRKKSATRGLLLPFKPVSLSWSGKGQLPILTNVEQQQHVPELSKLPLYCGYYVNELILKLLHRHDPHEALFDYYHEAIMTLCEACSPHTVLRIFEKRLLREIGFGLVLDHDVETGEVIESDEYYRYFPERGPVKEVTSVRGDSAGLVVKGETLIAMDKQEFNHENTLSQSRWLTRVLIDAQLNGKSLRSRRVLGEISRYNVV